MSNSETPPPIASLIDFSVSLDSEDRPTVTIHLSDKDEARAWAAWLFDQPCGVELPADRPHGDERG